jgi:hypothetical protein
MNPTSMLQHLLALVLWQGYRKMAAAFTSPLAGEVGREAGG